MILSEAQKALIAKLGKEGLPLRELSAEECHEAHQLGAAGAVILRWKGIVEDRYAATAKGLAAISSEQPAGANRFDVLDHGYVRLVESMGSDLSIVRAARVSYDAAWRTGEDTGSDHRLIHYLWKNRHTTPFEAVEFQFEVYAPIFVIRQWHRHRTWSFNELSGRYRELPAVFYVPDPAVIGEQSTDNKQGRQAGDPDLIEKRAFEVPVYRRACEMAFAEYRRLLDAGWPRELARSVLPVSTYSHMFAKTNLRNLLHFLDLRCHSHAQHELRVYADAMRDLARQVVPVALSAWEAK